jgi:hypothetical protein
MSRYGLDTIHCENEIGFRVALLMMDWPAVPRGAPAPSAANKGLVRTKRRCSRMASAGLLVALPCAVRPLGRERQPGYFSSTYVPGASVSGGCFLLPTGGGSTFLPERSRSQETQSVHQLPSYLVAASSQA